ncbi:TBC1 domain family member 20-like [Ostrea edulis]|uniref:TBC1 domain family member 20-like n=1 Tax=Ostrea edulis TaxID=37623 RepID=UPI0024AFBCF8|nr:TBC1 domain family member 20-like [Ostrea edulis]
MVIERRVSRSKREKTARRTNSIGETNIECIQSVNDGEDFPEKEQEIVEILSRSNVDVERLRNLAISPGGLLNDDIRKEVWPRLLNVSVTDIPKKPSVEVLHGHRDYTQVVMDVNRSLKRFPPGMEEEVRMSYQDQLVDLIMRVLVEHDELHYYQGYHDICVTFLLVLGEDLAFATLNVLSLQHLRDFMDSNMDRTKHILNYLYPIVGRANTTLRQFMDESEVGTVFSLSWLITWFGHVLGDLDSIVRLYDFFIACDPLMPIYMAASIVLYREKEILSSECEMCTLHGMLSKIPDNLPYEQLIVKAKDLFSKFPPKIIAEEAAEIHEQKKRALSQYKRPPLGKKREIHQREGVVKNLLYNDGNRLFVKVTLWTLVGVITAAGLSWLNSYYVHDYHS